jgi:hypothetical protein
MTDQDNDRDRSQWVRGPRSGGYSARSTARRRWGVQSVQTPKPIDHSALQRSKEIHPTRVEVPTAEESAIGLDNVRLIRAGLARQGQLPI